MECHQTITAGPMPCLPHMTRHSVADSCKQPSRAARRLPQPAATHHEITHDQAALSDGGNQLLLEWEQESWEDSMSEKATPRPYLPLPFPPFSWQRNGRTGQNPPFEAPPPHPASPSDKASSADKIRNRPAERHELALREVVVEFSYCCHWRAAGSAYDHDNRCLTGPVGCALGGAPFTEP